MIEFTNLASNTSKEEKVISVGNFDGIHLGHQKLLQKVLEISERKNLVPSIFTFKNHPAEFITKKQFKYLISQEDKKAILSKWGIDVLYNINFDEEMLKTSTEDFVKHTLKENLNVKDLILGKDGTIGNDRYPVEKISKICEKYSITLHVVDDIKNKGQRISSSKIRKYLSEGIVDKRLESLLGRSYSIKGTVVHGAGFGKVMGFPTANIKPQSDICIPKRGIYSCIGIIDSRQYQVALNIGIKPTVKHNDFTIEAFILDFEDDIYDDEIQIIFKEFIRDEKKFNSVDELKNQIARDVEKIRNTLKVKKYQL